MATLPLQVRRWLDEGVLTELVVVDLAGTPLRTPVVAEYDDDDLVMAVAEGGAVHLALIYDPQATVVLTAATSTTDGRTAGAEVRGEVEMTTAGAVELHRRTGGIAAPDGAWLVVRVIPTAIEIRA